MTLTIPVTPLQQRLIESRAEEAKLSVEDYILLRCAGIIPEKKSA